MLFITKNKNDYFLFFVILIVNSLLSLSKSIKIRSSSLSFELTISSANASSIYFCIARFKGRAPYCLSYPLSTIKSFAASVNVNSYPISLIRSSNFSNSISIIL